jgi:hypothetical protein
MMVVRSMSTKALREAWSGAGQKDRDSINGELVRRYSLFVSHKQRYDRHFIRLGVIA